MIFDTHAHYDDPAFAKDCEDIFTRFPVTGIGAVMDVASTEESCAKVLELAHSHEFIWAALGIHPSECGQMNAEKLQQLEGMLQDPKVRAVGEIGLDYHYEDDVDHETQRHWFREQLRMACRAGLPVIIHSRDAAKDTFDILEEELCSVKRIERMEQPFGVIHCYSYSVEMAREFVKMGFFIGIGGVVTFRNSKKLKEVVKDTPLSRIVLETDCPYMAPVPHRGERNSSLLLPYVVQAVAELKGVTPQEVMDVTWRNACNLYRI